MSKPGWSDRVRYSFATAGAVLALIVALCLDGLSQQERDFLGKALVFFVLSCGVTMAVSWIAADDLEKSKAAGSTANLWFLAGGMIGALYFAAILFSLAWRLIFPKEF